MAKSGKVEPLIVVRAAGAVVSRPGRKGKTEVLLIHRPKHQDWSLPKGKLDPGEDESTAAVREVFEETAVVCCLGEPLADIHYDDRNGNAKRVRYFRASVAADAGFKPNDEVDQVEWMSVKKALKSLTYEHDRKLIGLLDTDDPGSCSS